IPLGCPRICGVRGTGGIRVHECTERYKRWNFWITRIAMTVIAGFVAIAFAPSTELKALGIGLSTQALLRLLGKRIVKPTSGGDRTGLQSALDLGSVDVGQILNPSPQRRRPKRKTQAPTGQCQPAESKNDQPVNHH